MRVGRLGVGGLPALSFTPAPGLQLQASFHPGSPAMPTAPGCFGREGSPSSSKKPPKPGRALCLWVADPRQGTPTSLQACKVGSSECRPSHPSILLVENTLWIPCPVLSWEQCWENSGCLPPAEPPCLS